MARNMSMFSDIDAEIHRRIVQTAITKARKDVLPLCETAHAKDKVEAALEIISLYCNENIQE